MDGGAMSNALTAMGREEFSRTLRKRMRADNYTTMKNTTDSNLAAVARIRALRLVLLVGVDRLAR